jgi:hypothetical protein
MNNHFRALKKYAFSYDSSVIIKVEDIIKNNGIRFWPHTLDFLPNYTCPSCPTKKTFCPIDRANCSMESVWVIPLHYLNAEGKFKKSKKKKIYTKLKALIISHLR